MTVSPRNITTIEQLAAAGLVDGSTAGDLEAVAARYAVSITPAMARLIDAGDPADPVAHQFVPSSRELEVSPEELADPIGDEAHSPVTGIVHRHRDRVLLKLTGICPVYCRFCFRREMIGPDAGRELSAADLDAAIRYVAAHPEIFEVILTGGDPLVLSARRIEDVSRRLGAIDHVRILRWHSRVPVVAPERITPELVAALKAGGKPVFVAIHANHPRELTRDAAAAFARLADAGIVLVSQTVLLAGVNDDAGVLAELMTGFLANRVKPYYLHHPDLAPGTSGFRLDMARGQAIVTELRQRVSGLAQPTYVLDIPGGVAKVPIGPSHLDVASGMVRDHDGREHRYGRAREGGERG